MLAPSNYSKNSVTSAGVSFFGTSTTSTFFTTGATTVKGLDVTDLTDVSLLKLRPLLGLSEYRTRESREVGRLVDSVSMPGLDLTADDTATLVAVATTLVAVAASTFFVTAGSGLLYAVGFFPSGDP